MNDLIAKADLAIGTVGTQRQRSRKFVSASRGPAAACDLRARWGLAAGRQSRWRIGPSRQTCVLRRSDALGQLPPRTFGDVPNPVHDVKAAVRWARANASSLEISSERIGTRGASAGAYLVAMVGLTGGDIGLEGDVGRNLHQVQSFDAAVSRFGRPDLSANSRRSPVEAFLLSHAVRDGSAYGEFESPTAASWQVSPLSRESRRLHDALVTVGAASDFTIVGGAGHEDSEFGGDANLAQRATFLRDQLAPNA